MELVISGCCNQIFVHTLMELVVAMDIGLFIPPADLSAAPPSSSVSVEKGQVTQTAQGGTFSDLLEGFVQGSPVEEVSSDSGVPIPPPSCSAALPNLSALVESGQVMQPAQVKILSTSDQDSAETDSDEEPRAPSTSEDTTAPSLLMDAETQATIGSVVEGSLVSLSTVVDPQIPPAAEADLAGSAQNLQRSSPLAIESIPLVNQSVSVGETPEVGLTGQVGTRTGAAPPATTGSPSPPAPRPLVDNGQVDKTSAMSPKQMVSRIADDPSIQNGRGAPVDRAHVLVEQPPGNSVLSGSPPPSSLISDQSSSSVTENQGARNVLLAALAAGGVHTLDRSPTGAQPSMKVQEEGTQEATLRGRSLALPVVGVSGEGGEDLNGTDAQETGEGFSFQSREHGMPELAARGSQTTGLNGQFTSAQQAQPWSAGASVSTPGDNPLKTAQAYFGEAHSATMTSAAGKAQVIHMELPSHDSGPLSVRISMTDQTVHTQFTTDRTDLGTLLLIRQDQLQQNLTKSGLELGQFQVHIDQQGRQETLSDRQSRRSAGESDQQQTSQGHNQEPRDRERPHHRPPRALSLFA